MRVKVLGSAAGGGFPQWNCGCTNCRRLRQGTFAGAARAQAQIALSADGSHWALLNASPDLRQQIESAPELHPAPTQDPPPRHSPVSTVLLTGAELDQVLGLLLLRESQPLHVYSTASVCRILNEDNSLFEALRRQPGQSVWTALPAAGPLEIAALDGRPLGLSGETFPLPAGWPAYVSAERARQLAAAEAQIGLAVHSASGGTLGFLPGAPEVSDCVYRILERCDVVFFDGTFWTDDELIRVQGHGRTARQMGHLPVSGPGGSLERLSGLKRPRKIFIHINNTNPMLDEAGAEYARVRRCGWELARDGMEFTI